MPIYTVQREGPYLEKQNKTFRVVNDVIAWSNIY